LHFPRFSANQLNGIIIKHNFSKALRIKQMRFLTFFAKYFSIIGISGFWIVTSCQSTHKIDRRNSGKDPVINRYTPLLGGEETHSTKEGYALSDEGVATLDLKIVELNQELVLIEEELKISEGPLDNQVRVSWERIEEKREIVNDNIDAYNDAVQKEDLERATFERREINKLLEEIEQEVKILTQELTINNEREKK
jgi:hypothetical protein